MGSTALAQCGTAERRHPLSDACHHAGRRPVLLVAGARPPPAAAGPAPWRTTNDAVAGDSLQHHPRRLYRPETRSEEHTSELQSLMRISYAVFCLKKKNNIKRTHTYKLDR